MSREVEGRGHTVTVVLLAVAVLVALIVTTGVGLPGSSGGASPTGGVLPGTAPVLTPGATPTPSPPIEGLVTARAQHLTGHTWRFTYTVRNTGKAPIAGFQLNGPRANLFHLRGRSGWRPFGSGVCAGRYPGILVYWSTGKLSPTLLQPHQTATFSFTAQTGGTRPLTYSLSWSSAKPRFGLVPGPAASSLPVTGRCNR